MLIVLPVWALLAACTQKPAEPPAVPPAQPAAAAPAPAPAAQPAGEAAKDVLLAPEKATAQAPDVFKAKFSTTKGDFTIEVHRDWAPHGADRFYNLVKLGYFDDAAFYRDVAGFMVQFGINASPQVNAKWMNANIPDDAVKQSNTRGMITFATAGPNTRTTELFINFGNNASLDGMGFSPFGQVQGMEVVDSLYNGYGDMPQQGGRGPDPGQIKMQGNAYLKGQFPQIDYIKTARLVQ